MEQLFQCLWNKCDNSCCYHITETIIIIIKLYSSGYDPIVNGLALTVEVDAYIDCWQTTLGKA